MRRASAARELLDGPLVDAAALDGNLRDLARINQWLGGLAVSGRALDRLAGAAGDQGSTIRLLDVGTGAADIPVKLVRQWRRRGRRLEVVAIEDRAAVMEAAARVTPGLAREAVRTAVADARSLPFPDASFDVAHCSLVLHHLDPRSAVSMLREMARVSSRGIVVNDVARSRVAWIAAWLLTRVITGNRYTRHDGPLSVRRAYTVNEAHALLAAAGLRPIAEFRAPHGFRWAIAARP